MIRAVSVVSLLCLLVLVLYLPSAHPPDRFVELVRQEQQAIERFWGHAASLRILSRALAMADAAQKAKLQSIADAAGPGLTTTDLATAQKAAQSTADAITP